MALGGDMPSLVPPKQKRVSEPLTSGNSRRSRSNKQSKSKSGRGSDLDHVFNEAERKAKAQAESLSKQNSELTPAVSSANKKQAKDPKRFSLMDLEPI